jgi:hypothetical protein
VGVGEREKEKGATRKDPTQISIPACNRQIKSREIEFYLEIWVSLYTNILRTLTGSSGFYVCLVDSWSLPAGTMLP